MSSTARRLQLYLSSLSALLCCVTLDAGVLPDLRLSVNCWTNMYDSFKISGLSVATFFFVCASPLALIFVNLQRAGCTSLNAVGSIHTGVSIGEWWEWWKEGYKTIFTDVGGPAAYTTTMGFCRCITFAERWDIKVCNGSGARTLIKP